MIRRFFILLIISCTLTKAWAQEPIDTTTQRLYQRYYQLFATKDRKAFYDASEAILKHFQEKGDLLSYYKIRQNDVLYETQHGELYKALVKANTMLDDMKNDKVNHYDLVYLSLGAIFENRGNYLLAKHYYQKAIDNIDKEDTHSLRHAYAQLISIQVNKEPDKAWELNERMGKMSDNDPLYYMVYLTMKGEILFFKGNTSEFIKTKKLYDKYNQTHPNVNYGEAIMNMMQQACEGNYEEALQLLKGNIADLSDIGRCDYRIKIYKLAGQYEKALQETSVRRELRDSLNSDMIFDNMNAINAEVGLAKINEKAAKEREFWFFTVILLLLVALGLIFSRYMVRRRYQKRIIRQNEQLEIALSEAKESDRMKSLFIEHVSHEIRTPLNVVTGYAQIITNPNFKLNEEERNRMLKAIGENTVAITDIVNNLLEISQDESKERYRLDDTIDVNSLCQSIVKDAEKQNIRHLKLNYYSKLPDDFTIKSNQSGIEKILRHVIGNALKFTEEGQVELYVHESPDHGCVRFIVTDTGIGIAKELQERVFERFYKVDSFKQGFGLGLTMSRMIAEQLGGALVIDKSYENGTRLVLTVPVK